MLKKSVLWQVFFLAVAAAPAAAETMLPTFPDMAVFRENIRNMPGPRVVKAATIPDFVLDKMIPLFKNFPGGRNNRLEGWLVKEWIGIADIEGVDTEIGPAVHLRSGQTSVAIYKEMELNVKTHPILRWKWKATELPKGGDVRNKYKDDQAVQLYVVFPYGWPATLYSKAIGYIWDTSAPKGTLATNAKSSNIKYVVIEGGPEKLNQWLSEERNVLEDYRKLFAEEPPLASAISIMIDSDNTASSAESFIGDISLSAE